MEILEIWYILTLSIFIMRKITKITLQQSVTCMHKHTMWYGLTVTSGRDQYRRTVRKTYFECNTWTPVVRMFQRWSTGFHTSFGYDKLSHLELDTNQYTEMECGHTNSHNVLRLHSDNMHSLGFLDAQLNKHSTSYFNILQKNIVKIQYHQVV